VLFQPNTILTDAQLATLRSFFKRWGALTGAAVLLIFVWLLVIPVKADASQSVVDVITKVFFSVLRLGLGLIGMFLGVFIGYVIFQILESTSAGVHATRPETGDSDQVLQAKTLNRGILLTVLCASGMFVMAIVLAGVGLL
jgi:hypothetical protein